MNGNFDTGYIGPHKWHVEDRQGYDWHCVCGDHGRIVTGRNDAVEAVAIVMETFGQHAYEKLQEAAVGLVLQYQPHTRAVYRNHMLRAKTAQMGGHMDQQNILMMAANRRHQEAQEALEEQYRGLRWYPHEDMDGVGCDATFTLGRYWLDVHPDESGWTWGTWSVDPDGDDHLVTEGVAPTREEAQHAAWEALVQHHDDLEDREEDPF